MSKQLMRLRDVSEDEYNEVIALLEEHGLEYYETSAGNWGISMPALWIKNEDQYDQAFELFDQYQQQRSVRIRAEYEEMKARGELPTMWDRFLAAPGAFFFYLLAILAILYISVAPFVSD